MGPVKPSSKAVQNKHESKHLLRKPEKIKKPKTVHAHAHNIAIELRAMQFALNNFYTKYRTYILSISESLKSITELSDDGRKE